MRLNLKKIIVLTHIFCFLPYISKSNIEEVKNKILAIHKSGKLDSLVKSNENYILPFDSINLELEYVNKTSELLNAYIVLRKFGEAKKYLPYLKNLPDDERFFYTKYNAHSWENTIYIFDSGKKDLVKSNNLEMLRLGRLHNHKIAQISACENIAYRIRSSNRDSFLYYVKLIYELAQTDLDYRIHHAYMGEYYTQINADSAKFHYAKALSHALNTSDSLTIASSYTHYSNFLGSIGRFNEAIENAVKSLSFLDKNSSTSDFRYINTYISITEIYKDMEDFTQAEDYIKKAAALAEKNKYKIRNKTIGRIYGEVLFSQKRYKEALVEFNKAKEAFEKTGDTAEKFGNLINLAATYQSLKDYESSSDIINILKAKEDKLINHSKVQLKYYKVSGTLNSAQKKHKQAISNFLKAYKISNGLKLKAETIGIASLLANSYKLDKNWKQSNVFYEKAFLLRDSLFNEDIINTTKELDAVYQKAEQEKKIFKLNAENDANVAVLEQKNKTLTLGSIALFIITGLSFIAFVLYRNVKSKNKIVASALNEKDILLREIHHRVKNNLQVISSLLSLQSRQIKNEDIKQAINEGRNRVRSMALIHQNLYQKENLTGVSVLHYLNKLTSELFDTYNISEDRVKLKLNIEDIDLDVETMVPLGLIINELVSNSLKHAFPDLREGEIKVSLKESKKSILLSIQDNGIGTTQEIMENSKSFGNRLIKAFTNKLQGEFSVQQNNGTIINLVVKNYKKAS